MDSKTGYGIFVAVVFLFVVGIGFMLTSTLVSIKPAESKVEKVPSGNSWHVEASDDHFRTTHYFDSYKDAVGFAIMEFRLNMNLYFFLGYFSLLLGMGIIVIVGWNEELREFYNKIEKSKRTVLGLLCLAPLIGLTIGTVFVVSFTICYLINTLLIGLVLDFYFSFWKTIGMISFVGLIIICTILTGIGFSLFKTQETVPDDT